MRVLFVATDDYPHGGACTNILKKLFFYGGLLKKAEEVHVLTYKHDYNEPDLEIVEGVTIHRATVWSCLSVSAMKKEVLIHPAAAAKCFFHKLLDKLLHNTFLDRNIFRGLYCKLKQISAQNFDVIVPIAGNFSTVQAVWLLKKKYKQVNMVIYQVDPCASNLTASPETVRQRQRFEKDMYAEAKAILTTDIICKEQASKQSAEIASRFVPIEFPVVFEKQLVLGKYHKQEEIIRCLFAGNIYCGIRDPRYTFRLFERMGETQRIRFDVVGTVEKEIMDEQIPDNVQLCEPCSLEEIDPIIESADILVNIGNKMQNQVPSKIFDYIATGKPIVNVCKNRECPTLKYLRDYPLCLNLFEEDAILEEQAVLLQDFILRNYLKFINMDTLKEIYRDCTAEHCAKIIYETLM